MVQGFMAVAGPHQGQNLTALADFLKHECNLSDAKNYRELFYEAARQLGIDPEGKPLIELGRECVNAVGGFSGSTTERV